MAKQNTAPTMKDVAKEAGVSLGTVSKVINGIPVGDEYRKKVEQAIKTLDYHINAYAKGLKNNRTYTVAVILPNLLNPFFSMVAHYINRALVNRGYRMLLCDTEYDYTKEQEMVQMVAQNKVAEAIYDREVVSELYSTSGEYDLLAKIYVPEDRDVGHFLSESLFDIPDIVRTLTTMTFKAF